MTKQTQARKVQDLFDAADELLNEGRLSKDNEKIARSERVFNNASSLLKEYGLKREIVSVGQGRFDVRVVF